VVLPGAPSALQLPPYLTADNKGARLLVHNRSPVLLALTDEHGNATPAPASSAAGAELLLRDAQLGSGAAVAAVAAGLQAALPQLEGTDGSLDALGCFSFVSLAVRQGSGQGCFEPPPSTVLDVRFRVALPGGGVLEAARQLHFTDALSMDAQRQAARER
jgi:hypothetical protein